MQGHNYFARVNFLFLSIIFVLSACSDSTTTPASTPMQDGDSKLIKAIDDYAIYVRSSTPRSHFSYAVPKDGVVIPTLNGVIFNPIIESVDLSNIQLLYQYLYDPHPLIRQMAVAVIGQIESDQAVSRVMLASLLDPHPAVRMYSVYIIAYKLEDTPYEEAVNSWDIAFRIACRNPYELHDEFANWLHHNRVDLYPSKLLSYDIGDIGRRIGDGGG